MSKPLLKPTQNKPHTVYGLLRDIHGTWLGALDEPHDGTPDGMRAATGRLQAAADRTGYRWGGESSWIATDASGKAAWRISQNLNVVEPAGRPAAARAKARRPRHLSTPLALNPSHTHAPAVTAAFKARGFELYNTGGDVMAYRAADPTIGEVLVTDAGLDGGVPEAFTTPVSVFFFGLSHGEHLLELKFPSARAFLASVADVRRGAKPNGRRAAGARGAGLTPAQARLLARLVARAQRWIIADVQVGHVPRTVPDFAALHDYRDANMYALSPEGEIDAAVERAFPPTRDGEDRDYSDAYSFLGLVQDRLDAWVKTGALRKVTLKPGALATLKREAAERKLRNARSPYLAKGNGTPAAACGRYEIVCPDGRVRNYPYMNHGDAASDGGVYTQKRNCGKFASKRDPQAWRDAPCPQGKHTVRAVKRAKRNDWRSYEAGIRDAVAAGKPWHSEVMLPRGGSFFVRVRPLDNGAWQPELEADERHDYEDALRQYGKDEVTKLISRSVDMDLGMATAPRPQR